MRWFYLVVAGGVAALAGAQPSGAGGSRGAGGFWASPSLRLTRVTPAGGYWFAPVVSPDGRWLAVRRRKGIDEADDSPYGPLWLMAASGGAPQAFGRTVVSNFATWSPDSRILVWDSLEVSGTLRNSLRLKARGERSERDLIPVDPEEVEFTPAWSPKRQEVAFYSSRKEPLGLWTAQPGGPSRMIAHFPDHAGSDWMSNAPAWSPDGEWLAVERDDDAGRRIWVYSRDGRRSYRHRPGNPDQNTTDPAWSSDGRRLAYLEGDRRVMLANRDGTGKRQVWRAPHPGIIGGLDWAPGRPTLLVLFIPGQPGRRAPNEIWRLNATTAKAERILRMQTEWGRVSCLPAGRGFYFVREQGKESHVWRAVPRTGSL
jgi:WD40 repeat protein